MATGPEHYKTAEEILRRAGVETSNEAYNADADEATTMMIAAAQVHATLALAAAFALREHPGAGYIPQWYAWDKVAGKNDEGE